MLKLFLKSIVIGIANIIPGVSGGTAAVILGIYDDITGSIANFFKVNFEQKKKYFKFLVVFGLGIMSGILLFSKIIEYSIKNYPKTTTTIFTLLIIITAPHIIKGLDYHKRKNKISFCLGALIMIAFIMIDYLIKGDNNSIIRTTFDMAYYIKLFLCGIVVAGAMIIPGISGSLLLLMLGEYYNVVSFINRFKIIPLMFLGIGVVLGILIFSTIINYLLTKYREETLFFIFAIVCFSVIQIWTSIA